MARFCVVESLNTQTKLQEAIYKVITLGFLQHKLCALKIYSQSVLLAVCWPFIQTDTGEATCLLSFYYYALPTHLS